MSKSKVTEIERAAMTLLAKATIYWSEKLADWVEDLTTHPDYDELHHCCMPESAGYEVDSEYLNDWAVWALASSLAIYRSNGRPQGDVTTNFTGTGLSISTSLSAAVVEFHERIINAWATMFEEREEEREDKD